MQNLLKASDALQIMQGENPPKPSQLSTILARIKIAASNGQGSITVDEIPACDMKSLKDLGYGIFNTFSFKNQSFGWFFSKRIWSYHYSIRWNGETEV